MKHLLAIVLLISLTANASVQAPIEPDPPAYSDRHIAEEAPLCCFLWTIDQMYCCLLWWDNNWGQYPPDIVMPDQNAKPEPVFKPVRKDYRDERTKDGQVQAPGRSALSE